MTCSNGGQQGYVAECLAEMRNDRQIMGVEVSLFMQVGLTFDHMITGALQFWAWVVSAIVQHCFSFKQSLNG